MKYTFKLLLLICMIALLPASCGKDIAPGGEVSVSFTVNLPATKAISDGSLATELNVRLFDAGHNFLYEQKASRQGDGWSVDLKLVPGTYSFSFWAQSSKADAFSFEGEYMNLSYPLMDMNSDDEDAFWASVADMEVTGSFTRRVTLKRPFAFIQLVSDSFINESLDGATSAFSITGAACTRMNLISGSTDGLVRKAIYNPAPVSDYTSGRRTIAAYTYVLVPDEGTTSEMVEYNITLSDGRTIDGTVQSVPLTANFRTTLSDN